MSGVRMLRPDLSTGVPSRYATDCLLRLSEMLHRRDSAARLLYGSAGREALSLLDRAILSLYADCRDAGVEDAALEILCRSQHRTGSTVAAA